MIYSIHFTKAGTLERSQMTHMMFIYYIENINGHIGIFHLKKSCPKEDKVMVDILLQNFTFIHFQSQIYEKKGP